MTKQIGVNKIGEFQYSPLLAGDAKRVTTEITLKAGQVYPVGAALGRAAADKICTLVDKDASDGTEEIYAILPDAVDATASDIVAVGYLSGQFNRECIVFGSGTYEDYEDAARALGIYFMAVSTQPNQ